MEYRRVNSSNIRDIGYDISKAELRVIFADGSEYAYSMVGPETYKSLINSASKGSHFHAHIKGKFDHRKISGDDDAEDE